MQLTCFDHFPEPVFYIRDGRIEYRNDTAAKLEPAWTVGAAVPDSLGLVPDEEGVFSCVLGGREFQAAATVMDEGLLLVLRPPVKAPAAEVLTMLPIQIREMINNIQAVTRLWTPLAEHDGGENVKLHLAVLNQSFYRLLRLARHLELSRQADRDDPTEIQKRNVDLAQVCRDVAYGAAELARQAGVEFHESVPGGIVPSVGDRELLEVMLLELISNAIKAAGSGGEAGIRLSTNASRVLITVWDNGPGMSQAELTGMMDGTSPDSLPKPGTGLRLGLPIARYVAKIHGGAVLLESREGEGLKVTASLPLKKPIRGEFHTPVSRPEEGFSSLLTLLSDCLPWQAFEE